MNSDMDVREASVTPDLTIDVFNMDAREASVVTDRTTPDSDMDDDDDSKFLIDQTGGSLIPIIGHYTDIPGGSRSDRTGGFSIRLIRDLVYVLGGSLISLDRDSVIHLTENSDMDATTEGSVMQLTEGPPIRLAKGSVISITGHEVIVIDLIRGMSVGLDAMFNFFPNYQPMFREEPYLNPVLPFVCQDNCFLRNWLFAHHKLVRRFWADLLEHSGRDLPFSNAVVASTLEEMSGFFAFVTTPFHTQRLPNNNKIEKVGRLLRPNLGTLELVWRFYEQPLLVEICAALGEGPVGTEPSDQAIEAHQKVKAVFLEHQLEADKDFVLTDATVTETVFFNAEKPNHARELERYWYAKFKDNLYEKLPTLGPWMGCGNEERGRQRKVSRKINETEPKIDLPRIRSPLPPVSRDSWLEVANTLHEHSKECSTLFRSFSREDPEPPRQPSYGNEWL